MNIGVKNADAGEAKELSREEAGRKYFVEHSQRSTEKGVVDIDAYSKEKGDPVFRKEELENLLAGLAGKEDMVILKIDYCFFDYWGYRKYYTLTSKEDIHKACDMPLAIDAYFTDSEMKYRFVYLDDENRIIIAKCRKDTGIDLREAFDDDFNREAGGLLKQGTR